MKVISKFNRQIFAPTLLLLLLPGISTAQLHVLSGQVTNQDNSPLTGALIEIKEAGRSAFSNEKGNFIFEKLSPGTYHISVSYLGYQTLRKTIDLTKNTAVEFKLESGSVDLSEVTVLPEKSSYQSQGLTQIDKTLRPVNSGQDLLQLVPGLFIAQHAGGGKAEQIFLRGFDIDHGTDFNISVDGMPVNMVSHAHGQGYADFHFVIPETIDRLRVYKGPYASRFGDFATSGTGEFFTKNTFEKNIVKAEYGRFDTYRTLGIFSPGNKNHLLTSGNEDAYIAAEYVFTNSYFENKQKLGRFNIFGKYSAVLNEKNYFSLSVSTFRAAWYASGQVPQRAVDNGTISRFGSIDPTEGGTTGRTNVNMTMTSTLKDQGYFRNQLYYVKYDFSLYSNFTFFLNDSVNGDQINQTDHRDIIGYQGVFEREFRVAGKELHFTTGIGTRNDFTDITLRNSLNRMILDTIRSGSLYQQNSHVFADAVYHFNSKFSMNSGLRLDIFYFDYRDDKEDTLSGKKVAMRVSPKLNIRYLANEQLSIFLRTGIGFHSNDARSVVIGQNEYTLPRAFGGEIGSEFKPLRRLLVNIAFWELYLQSELVYTGDEGTVSTNEPTNRLGADLSVRYQLTDKLFADIDLNYNYGRILNLPEGENYIPLAPRITSSGGFSYKREKGMNGGIRYRWIDSRPANETNSVTAEGYFLLDAVASYKLDKVEFGIAAENLLNSIWNQAQFDTTSKLLNEASPISELHYTPGTPFFIKGIVTMKF